MTAFAHLCTGDYALALGGAFLLKNYCATAEDYLNEVPGESLGRVEEGQFCLIVDVKEFGSAKRGRLFLVLTHINKRMRLGWLRNIDVFAGSREPPTYMSEAR